MVIVLNVPAAAESQGWREIHSLIHIPKHQAQAGELRHHRLALLLCYGSSWKRQFFGGVKRSSLFHSGSRQMHAGELAEKPFSCTDGQIIVAIEIEPAPSMTLRKLPFALRA